MAARPDGVTGRIPTECQLVGVLTKLFDESPSQAFIPHPTKSQTDKR